MSAVFSLRQPDSSGSNSLPHHGGGYGQFPGLITFGIVAVWFTALIYVGDLGILKTWRGIGPFSALQTFMIAPPLIFILAYGWLASFRRYINAIDPLVLASLQIFRILGTAHFISWGYGLIPGYFAIAVGAGNFIISTTAFYATYRTAYRLSGWRVWLYALTFLGLLEFVMTIVLANLGYFFRAAPFDPPVAVEGYTSFLRLPISIFPSYLIPLFMVIHLATLFRLWCGAR